MNKSKNTLKVYKKDYIRVILFLTVSFFSSLFILYTYEYVININTLMFIILIPIMLLPFFISKDLMNPFNIFFMSSQFLFVFNMIDINANKNYFRYGNLDSSYHDEAFFWAILIIIIWYLHMYLGYYIAKKANTNNIKKLSIFRISNTEVLSILLIFIGIVSYIYMIYTQSGIGGIVEGLSGRVEAYAGLHYFLRITRLTTIGAMLLLGDGYKKTSFIVIILSFLMLATYGGRGGAFFSSIFPFLIFYHYQVKKLNIIRLIPLGIITILFAIGLGNYRLYQEIRINVSSLYDLLSNISHSTQGGEILPSLIGSLLKGNIDYKYGSTLINIVFAPIPRTIWSNKPQIDESGIVGQALMGDNSWGLPPGPYGISFFNFGFLGVIIIAFILGYIIYKIYYRFVLSSLKSKYSQIFYVLIIFSMFNLVSTSAQINLLWYVFVFISIKLVDILISILKRVRYPVFKKYKVYSKGIG